MLEPKGERSLPASETAVMDQVALTFIPEILIARTGQAAEFRNSDDTLHNVHVTNLDTKEPAFNVAIPTGEKYLYTFAKAGLYHVGCDIHPAMAAEIVAASTPFVMVAGADGGFTFVEVPPGLYVLKSLSGGTRKEREVDVKLGANAVALAP